MQSALDAVADGEAQRTPEAALDAAISLLDSIVGETQPTRAGALTLLAADALVTRAFEDAADRPAGLEDRAADAMRRIARAAAERPR